LPEYEPAVELRRIGGVPVVAPDEPEIDLDRLAAADLDAEILQAHSVDEDRIAVVVAAFTDRSRR
jgi:hypothetical protein